MALFRKAQRKRSPRTEEDRVSVALDLLTGLCGVWTGVRCDYDPDQRVTRAGSAEVRRSLRMDFELNPERSHVIAHNEVSGQQGCHQTFDVWGREAGSGELFRTIFADEARQTSIYDIARLDLGRDRRTWRIIVETVSWDEARPCEIRYEMSRLHNQLDLNLTRRLINHGADYELVNRAILTRNS